MKKKNKIKNIFIFIILLHLLFISTASAHPGRTDSNGGHWDHSSGTYHYHTGEHAGQSNSSSSTSEKSSWEKYKEERQSNTTIKYENSTKTTNSQDNDSNLWTWILTILAILFFRYAFYYSNTAINRRIY